MGLRIVVDLDLASHGVCESEAPDVFEVGKDRKVELLDATPDESLRKSLELAVKYCPTHALSLVEDWSPHHRTPTAHRSNTGGSHDRIPTRRASRRWSSAGSRPTATGEAAGDWKPLADMYTEDATYGWNYGPTTDFMAIGRGDPRAGARRRDGRPGRVGVPARGDPDRREAGLRRGVLAAGRDDKRPDGSTYEVHGIGGSWFRYAGNFQWSWQRDRFDFGNAGALFLEMMQADKLSEGMTADAPSMSGPLPGYYPAGTSPVKLWDR